MRTLVLWTSLLLATACGHNKTTSTAQNATAVPADKNAKVGDRDNDEKTDQAKKGHDKDGDDDDGDDEGPAKK
jgi:hypothetical protein